MNQNCPVHPVPCILMRKLSFLLVFFGFLSALRAVAADAQPPAPFPYVVMVSLDGFRHDYAERYQAKNLLAMRDAGASARSMIPTFPSLTFPNHYSIITGLYPEHHGIVSNNFYDPARDAEYSLKKTAADGSWYSGKPLWVLAEEQQIKTAAMFWPGSEAEIGGVRPSYWLPYDDNFPDEQRVDRVIGWLKLPENQRPHFITLYFSDVDTAGHKFGPESAQTAAAVQKVDGLMGSLRQGIAATGLPVNLIVVSDHGMQLTNGYVNLSDYLDLTKLHVATDGPLALLYAPDQRTAKTVYAALKGKSPRFDVYWRKDTPAAWHFRENPRAGDVVLMVRDNGVVVKHAPTRPLNKGAHGFDPGKYETMRSIFYAAGPNIREHVQVPPFENVHIYPFVAELMGLKITSKIDGSAKVLHGIYRP